MKRHRGVPSPLSLWTLSLEASFLYVEALSIITMRTLSMSGLRPMAPTEPVRMILEKPPAFYASGLAAWTAMLGGKSPEAIVASSLKPLRRKTRANHRRLSRTPAAARR